MTPAFRRVGRLAKGYDVHQVDELFRRRAAGGAPAAGARGGAVGDARGRAVAAPGAAQVRLVAFRLRRRGYDVAQVDDALDRLEDRAAAGERQRLLDSRGEEALLGQLGRMAASLDGRLARPPGRRFRRGRRWERAYDPSDVDALCERVRAYLDAGAAMAVEDVRAATFRGRRGRRGYREADVDAFLDRAVALLLAVG